jgi:penicillin amidase
MVVALLVAVPALLEAAPDAVTIVRDAFGVPQIFTDGADALVHGAYADGFAQAEDRLFEMDILRRAATGRLAQMLGASFIAMDEVTRRDLYTRDELEQMFARLATRDQQAIEAYRDGVNAYVTKVTLDPMLLPFEFGGVPPEPWEVSDTVAVAALQFVVFGANGGQEVLNADFLLDLLDRFPAAEAAGMFDDLYWLDDPAAPTTIAPEDGTTSDPDEIERFAPAQLELLRSHASSIHAAAQQLRSEQGLLGGLGAHRHASNAIVVSPALSASGNPILLGGPQTGLDAPSLFWEGGLHGGGYDAEGVNGPAGPGVLIGRGANFAMTITSGILDDVDTFMEPLDPADPGRYLYQGRSLPFVRRTEKIEVAGAADVTLEVLRSVHGPVFLIDPVGGVAFSRRASFRGKELESAAAIVGMGFVRTLDDFRRLADRVSVSLNLHYADVAGNIAYFHRGTRPLRPLHTDPRLPLDGNGSMEWRGVTPPSALPSVVNPKRGFITNWNNKPIAGWSTGEQREIWGVVDRVGVFIDALEAARTAGRKLDFADVESLMRHAATADIFAAHVLPFLEDSVSTLDPASSLRTAVAHVRAWVDAGASLIATSEIATPEANAAIPDPGAAIYTEFRAAAQAMTFADELGAAFRPMFYPSDNMGNQEDDHGSFGSPDALFLRALLFGTPLPTAPVPSGFLPVSRNYFDDVSSGTLHTRAEILRAALQTAIDRLTAQFGTSDQARWQLPALRETYMDFGAIGPVFGPTVMPRENRGSFNLVVELGRAVHGEIIVPPGESGSFTSADAAQQVEPAHLRDQLPLYSAFEYRRQPFRVRDLEPPLTIETIPVIACRPAPLHQRGALGERSPAQTGMGGAIRSAEPALCGPLHLHR